MSVLVKASKLCVLPRGRPDFLLQLVIWFGFVFAYQAARGLADRDPVEALANGRRVVRLEQRLGSFFEPDVQRPVLQTGHLLVHAVDWTYWLSQFAVVGLALFYIYLRHNNAYLHVRNTLIITNTLGLLLYILLPTAPPRLVSGVGIADTLAHRELINHHSALVQLAANPYAAMPSLHAADAAIIGIALAWVVRPKLAKLAFAVWPAWVSFSLIASGNHFWLDIAAGFLLAAFGAWMAGRLPWYRLGLRRPTRRPLTRAADAS
jgi:membrane-associated phospholipid phosphatase